MVWQNLKAGGFEEGQKIEYYKLPKRFNSWSLIVSYNLVMYQSYIQRFSLTTHMRRRTWTNFAIIWFSSHVNTMFKFPRLKLAIFATCRLPPQSPPGICLCTSAYLCIGMFSILLTALLQRNHLMLFRMLRMLPSTRWRLVKGWSCYLRVWDRCVLSFIAFWSSPHLLCLAQTSVPQSSSLVDMEVKRYGSWKGMEVEKGWK